MRIAIIGLGRMGRRHLQVARAMGLELVGVCDTQQDALAATQREQAVEASQAYAAPERLLEETKPECVVIATTAPARCSLTRLAAESGVRYILCEKPMAVSMAECEKMIEVCGRHGARLAVNHQMRFMEQYSEPKRLSQAPEFGGLRSVTVVAGNFGLAMNGSHYFEMFRYMADEPPVEVTAWFSLDRVPNPRGPQFEDRAGCVRLVTNTGIRFYLDASSDQGHGFQVIYAGRYGQIMVDEATGALHMAVREEQHRSSPTTRYLTPFNMTSKQIAPVDTVGPSRAVLSALLKGENYPTGEDGRLAVHVLTAAHLSNESEHRPIRLDDPRLDRNRVFPWA